MEEIDKEPIQSVRTALSFFGQRKNSPTIDKQEVAKERELENLTKDFENVKFQLEAKDSAYKQSLLKLDHHKKTAEELSTLLRNSDFQKEFYMNECLEADFRINELESAMKQIEHQLSESKKVREQLSHVASDLVSTQGQQLNLEAEVALLREAKVESISQAEAMESALREEKLKMEELLRRVSEMNETIMELRRKALEIETEKAETVSKKEAELELAAKAVAEAQKQLEIMHDWENQLLENSACIGSLQVELRQANELHIYLEKAASDATSELNRLKEDMELQEKKNLDQLDYISLLETELKQLRAEFGNANAEAHRLNEYSEKMKSELETSKEKQNDAQVEIALLKFELHKGKLKLAAAEAAEARAQNEKSALYNALHQLKEAMKLPGESISSNQVEPREIHSQAKETQNTDERSSENEGTISTNQYEDLLKMVEKKNPLHENEREMENMKKELEFAMSKVGELRTRAEQAISRAEAAERAKAVLEDEMKRLKEPKERKKADLIALQEESISEELCTNNSIKYDTAARYYQPLGKVLDMKFQAQL